MATKEAKPAADAGEVAPPPKSKKLLIIIIAAVLLLAIAAGGAWFLLKPKPDAEHPDDEEAAEETVKAKKKDKKKDQPPIFVSLEPFTVNLVQESGDQYLQLSISIELEEATGEQAIKANMPKIRNAITMLLSTKKASELVTRDGKEKLALELKDATNEILAPDDTPKKGKKKAGIEGPVKAILYTAFIIQ